MYKIPDEDDLDPSTLSLCSDCAKDESLKRFVTEHKGGVALCGICLSPYSTDRTCVLERKTDLANLMKALMRFHFDESDYNPHWGGEDDPGNLLYRDNPILHHETTLFHSRSKAWSWLLLEDLFGEPYPDPATGISIYAGFYDGIRMLHRAISRGENMMFGELRGRLLKENYFNVEPVVRDYLASAGGRIARTIPAGTVYSRARIGARRFTKTGDGSLAYKPYEGSELGAPPAPKATSGRLNRGGVAFLYLATDDDTAAAEVRPHPSHVLSIGKFVTAKDLRVAAFDVGITEFFGSEKDLDLFDFLFTADKAMSMPALPEDETRYSITQLVADAVRNAGYDGVTFRSSVASGHNLCIFSPDGLSYADGSASPVEVTKLVYTMTPAPVVAAPDADGYYAVDD